MLLGHLLKLNEIQEIGRNLKSLEEVEPDFVEIKLNRDFKDYASKKLDDILKSFSNPPIVHAPEIELTSPFSVLYEAHLKLFTQAIDFARKIDASKMVLHPVISRTFNLSDEALFQMKVEMLEKLREMGESRSIMICLENTAESHEEMMRYFDAVNGLYLCLDVGHANLMGMKNRAMEFISNLGGYIRHLHISDNYGGFSHFWDLHLPVGAGNIDFRSILGEVRKIYNDTITLEVYGDVDYLLIGMEKIRGILRDIEDER